ncbi:MAG: NUDIX hydrolase [Acidimicrobiia bacterium]
MSRLAAWNWCPICKEKLRRAIPEGDDRERLCCTACGLIIYDNPAPCACAVVVRDEKVLLTRRAVEPALGLWDLPGGYIEIGETPEETLKRELLEETGLEVRIAGFIGFFVDTYGDGGSDTLNISYECAVVAGLESPGSDVAELGWFLPDALPAPHQLAFRNTREALERWLASRGQRRAAQSKQ